MNHRREFSIFWFGFIRFHSFLFVWKYNVEIQFQGYRKVELLGSSILTDWMVGWLVEGAFYNENNLPNAQMSFQSMYNVKHLYNLAIKFHLHSTKMVVPCESFLCFRSSFLRNSKWERCDYAHLKCINRNRTKQWGKKQEIRISGMWEHETSTWMSNKRRITKKTNNNINDPCNRIVH